MSSSIDTYETVTSSIAASSGYDAEDSSEEDTEEYEDHKAEINLIFEE